MGASAKNSSKARKFAQALQKPYHAERNALAAAEPIVPREPTVLGGQRVTAEKHLVERSRRRAAVSALQVVVAGR